MLTLAMSFIDSFDAGARRGANSNKESLSADTGTATSFLIG
jgi:hypothetical protein